MIFVSCKETKEEKTDTEIETIVNIFPDTEITNVDEPATIENEEYYEDGEDVLYEEKAIGEKGSFNAVFSQASIVEGIIALHFIKTDSGEEVMFTEFDIDPEKLGLFSYKKVDGAIFPELITNPEIENVVYKLFWEVEEREVDLVGLTNTEVLKKIERLN